MSLSAAERATEPVATLRPAQLWQHIAQCGRQFLLLGDNDHGNPSIVNAVSQAVPWLAMAGGYRHMGIEWEESAHGAAARRFHKAAAQRASDTDVRRYTAFVASQYSAGGSHIGVQQRKAISAEVQLHIVLREFGVKPHMLREQLDFETTVAGRRGNSVAARFQELVEACQRGGQVQDAATRREMSQALAALDRWDAQNLKLDGHRMRKLQSAVQGDKAIVFYGAGHFRRSRSEGMDKHLPPGSTAYVLIGSEGQVGGDMALNWQVHRGSVPDFVITTDTRKGYVMPPAIRNGLWPKAQHG